MKVLGLTGSIGMGKSTVNKMFAELGIPCWDADLAVDYQYLTEEMAEFVALHFPDAINDAGEIDRKAIGDIVFKDPLLMGALKRQMGYFLEVEAAKFEARARYPVDPKTKHPFIVLDVPLLFEGGWVRKCDLVMVVHCSPEQQMERILARPGMTEERAKAVIANQMPSAEKMKQADILIDTSKTIADVRARVLDIFFNATTDEWVAEQSRG